MTTPFAAALYEAQHLQQHEGRPLAVYNPKASRVEDLPVIYGFNNGGSPGWMQAALVAEDGAFLGGHVCSSEAYMPADLGCLEGTRPERHEKFAAHYPDGYRMEFVGYKDVAAHDKLSAALRLHASKGLES